MIITLDLDFSDICTCAPSESQGIIVLRPASQDKESILGIMDRVIPLLASEAIVGRLWIVGRHPLRSVLQIETVLFPLRMACFRHGKSV